MMKLQWNKPVITNLSAVNELCMCRAMDVCVCVVCVYLCQSEWEGQQTEFQVAEEIENVPASNERWS